MGISPKLSEGVETIKEGFQLVYNPLLAFNLAISTRSEQGSARQNLVNIGSRGFQMSPPKHGVNEPLGFRLFQIFFLDNSCKLDSFLIS